MDAHGFSCSDNNIIVDDDAQSLSKLPREIQLIEHVAREQALYNPKHEFYRNAARKDVKWGEIGTAIGWTEPQCKAKWKAFRDQYCRELKRSKINTKATVKWKYFKYLEFLRPFALSRNYRPRYVPTNSNANGTNLSNSSTGGIDDHKKTITAAIIGSDYGLLQNIKMEPKSQHDDREFVDDIDALTSTLKTASAEQNVKNETIVLIAPEQYQHLNSVLQQQQQTQQQQQQHHQQQQQQHHAENWGFLTSTTNGANDLLTTHQQQQQQLTTNTFNNNNNSSNNNNNNNNNNDDNNILDAKDIDQSSNSSADYALLHNAIADCVAAAEADVSQLSHPSQHPHQHHHQTKAQEQQQQQEIYMFQASPPPAGATSSDEEDDDPIHKFLNIESYFEKELIAMVRSEDILYNSFNPNYRNAKRKLDVWADIARKMKKTVKQCRLKWKALRDQYIREHKRLRNRINIETLPRWKHYDALNFLHNFIKHKSESEEKKIFQQHLQQPQQQQQQQQQLQLHPALIGLSNALAEHQRQQQQHQYHEDLKSNLTISSTSSIAATVPPPPPTPITATTATTNEASVNTTASLVNIDENQSNSADDYDAMDIDNYINGNGDTSDIVMHENDDDDDDVDGVDGVDVDDDDVDDDDDGDDGIINNNNEHNKAVKNISSYNHTNRVGCVISNTINGGGGGVGVGVVVGGSIESTQNQVDSLSTSDFRKLKDIVSRTNSPVLLSISNSQQQLCHQTQNNQQLQHHHHHHHQHESDHIMGVVSLACDDVVVLGDTNGAAQLGFVVPSSATVSTVASPAATTSVTSAKTSLAMQQRDFTEHLVKLTTQATVSPTTTRAISESTLPTLNATSGNIYYHHHHHHNNNSNNTTTNSSNNANSNNNNSNNSNNNDITVAAVGTHDVSNVFSAIATCADFAASFDDCSTSTITATSSLPSSLIVTAAPVTTISTISNSNLALPCAATLHPPIATTTLTSTHATTTTAATTTTPMATAHGSIAPLHTTSYANANDDDEVGVFFRAIAMKIRSVHLSPIEFTDLQIEVLRVINQSLRKN